MLPNRPNGGLPSGPRSRSVGRSRQHSDSTHYNSEHPASSRQVRTHASMASFPRESLRTGLSSTSRRSETPHRTPHTRSDDIRSNINRSRHSEDSVTSSGSSLFERMKNGAASYASSFTSVDDEDDFKAVDDARGRSLRYQRLAKLEPSSQDSNPLTTDTGTGDGSTVWSRVATAASTLTVSVSKAWASNITTFSGEETPPGQESRLTRAMKAYHIEKARDPSDLPAWLFEEHERQPRTRSRPLRDREVERAPEEISRPRRAREVADTSDRFSHRASDASSLPPIAKGTDRLKALREARRNVAGAPENTMSFQDRQRAPRIGLPSGPMARSRRS